MPGLCLAGEANGEMNPIFRLVGARVLADGAQNAFPDRLLGRAGGSAGVLESRGCGTTSRWRPCGLAAGVCGLSADLLHDGKALCMARSCCI